MIDFSAFFQTRTINKNQENDGITIMVDRVNTQESVSCLWPILFISSCSPSEGVVVTRPVPIKKFDFHQRLMRYINTSL